MSVELTIPVAASTANASARVAALLAVLPDGVDRVCVAVNGDSPTAWDNLCSGPFVEDDRVRLLRCPLAGKGAGVKAAWVSSGVDTVAFCDLDGAGLGSLPGLLAALDRGAVLACGSRCAPGARAHRSGVRRFTRGLPSWAYRRAAAALVDLGVDDPQCGLKAARRADVLPILAEVEASGWGFDTELVALARRSGLRVTSVPIDWVDGPQSTVRVVQVSWVLALGLLRLRRRVTAGGGGA